MNYKIEDSNYFEAFWNMMRGQSVPFDKVSPRMAHKSFALPKDSLKKYQEMKDKEDIFKGIVTRVEVLEDTKIMARTVEHEAEWVPELTEVPIFDADEDYEKFQVARRKIAAIVRLSNDFIHSPSFDIESNVLGTFAKAMNRAEELAIINGDGVDMPYGLLHETLGAEVGINADSLTFDNVISLFLSVKAKYRKNGKWLMNDETALILRTLKDKDGNYLWNHSNDTILGKEVIISEYMPAERTPVLFGDLSKYLVIDREHLRLRELKELYAMDDRTGYLGFSFLDGRLTKRDAVKILRIL